MSTRNTVRFDDLPFDLDKRRAVPYRAAEGEANRSEAKRAVVGRLSLSLKTMIADQEARPVAPKGPSPGEVAIEAIEHKSAAVGASMRDFWKWLIAELEKIQPNL